VPRVGWKFRGGQDDKRNRVRTPINCVVSYNKIYQPSVKMLRGTGFWFYIFFYGFGSVYLPSSRLVYTLTTCRFLHYTAAVRIQSTVFVPICVRNKIIIICEIISCTWNWCTRDLESSREHDVSGVCAFNEAPTTVAVLCQTTDFFSVASVSCYINSETAKLTTNIIVII